MTPDMPITIAFCITELEVGGAERALVELATRLDRVRFSPRVYCLAPRPNQTLLVERLEAAGVETCFLDGRRRVQAPAVFFRLSRLLKKQRPEIFQSFLFHANALGTLAARAAGIRRIYTGIRVAERRGQHYQRIIKRLDPWVTRHVCVSQAVARDFCQRTGFPGDRTTVIPNGIDLANYASPNPLDLGGWGIPPGAPCIAYVGRLDPQKGTDLLAKMLPLLAERLPEVHFLIAGQGPLRGNIEQHKADPDLGPRVHLLGFQQEVPALLAASRLLVLPSRWEGMPNVLLEAMAARLPFVAFDVEGVREVVGDDADPQIVPAEDVDAFMESVTTISGDPQLRVELGRRNRQRVESHFQIEAMVRAYESLYEEALAVETRS